MQGRQGGNPFYPSEKVHKDRNKDEKIEQRKFPKAVISSSVEVKNVCWNTFGVPFFLFQMASYVFVLFFVCFFCVGPSASMRVRIWMHRYFFTCNNFT